MKMKYIRIIFLIIACHSFVLADEGDVFDFPDEIKAYGKELEFEAISADSANRIIALEETRKVKEDDANVMVYQYQVGEKIYLAIKYNGNWKSGFVCMVYSTLFGSGPEYNLLSLDDKGRKGVLVSNYTNSSKGARYYNYDYRSCRYELIDIATGKVYDLGETYTDEGSGYEGFRAQDTAGEEKEMKEMDKEENWKRRYEAFEYELEFTSGKVLFKNIVCDGCEVEGLDAISTIEYIWKDDKLIKDKVTLKK